MVETSFNPPASWNVEALFSKIHSLIVKTIISVEPLLQNGVEMYLVPSKKTKNCFEVLGFDVLIDDQFNPWLLEVNLSPSMNTDSPLDFRIKSNMLVDLFNLVGFSSSDPNSNQSLPFKRSKSKQQRALTLKTNPLGI